MKLNKEINDIHVNSDHPTSITKEIRQNSLIKFEKRLHFVVIIDKTFSGLSHLQ